jgi:N-glycosylase/DNA lyase
MGGREALLQLRSRPLEEVRGVLTSLAGVGPKVADCVALFSLDQRGSIPVDTHVWQVGLHTSVHIRWLSSIHPPFAQL